MDEKYKNKNLFRLTPPEENEYLLRLRLWKGRFYVLCCLVFYSWAFIGLFWSLGIFVYVTLSSLCSSFFWSCLLFTSPLHSLFFSLFTPPILSSFVSVNSLSILMPFYMFLLTFVYNISVFFAHVLFYDLLFGAMHYCFSVSSHCFFLFSFQPITSFSFIFTFLLCCFL